MSPTHDLKAIRAHLRSLRTVYVQSHPQARLHVIEKRLAQQEIGVTKLITAVSAVEALARSIVVHSLPIDELSVTTCYEVWKFTGGPALVEEVLKFAAQADALALLGEETWTLFGFAVSYRNLIIHECTFLGQDSYPRLIEATMEVFDALVTAGGLQRSD